MNMRTRFGSLLLAIHNLNDVLPARSATAAYSDEAIQRIYAYRLLAHAELEGFLEGLATEIVDEFSHKYKTAGLSRSTLERLHHHLALVESYPPRTLSWSPGTAKGKGPIPGLLNTVQAMIDANNGVSEKDVLKLFVPLGFQARVVRSALAHVHESTR
nr:hypothetical protein [Angustibacter aerolatus]